MSFTFLESDFELFSVHLSVCNTNGIRVKLEYLFYNIPPESFLP